MSNTNDYHDAPNQDDPFKESSADYYIVKAADACDAGDLVLGMHLYLAAYEKAMADPVLSDQMAQRSLRAAWHLACELKERSMAEYVFEKLEPYLTGEEIARCAEQLQRLALDRLEEFGFSRGELEDMAEMISQDFLGGETPVFQVASVIPAPSLSARVFETHDEADDSADDAKFEPDVRAEADVEAEIDSAAAAETNSNAEAAADAEAEVDSEPAVDAPREDAKINLADAIAAHPGLKDALSAVESADDLEMPAMPPHLSKQKAPLNYSNLVGYNEAVAIMRDLGVGLDGDIVFQSFVEAMNKRHGLDRMPALDSMLFRSPAREDAIRFIEATIGELGLPTLRISMEENFQGMPILCLTAQSDNHPRMNRAQNRFIGPATLVLEDLDMWIVPQPPENVEGMAGFMMANMSRGARKAMNLVRSAVEDPDVYVLASASTSGEIDPFFLEMLEPVTIIDIDYPTDAERSDIWAEIVRDHPSMRMLNRVNLMRLSAGMPRFDIYMAAREAIEEAYKLGLMMRTYMPVTDQIMFEKLACFQPLDSQEYQALEDEVIRSFKADLDHLEDLLN